MHTTSNRLRRSASLHSQRRQCATANSFVARIFSILSFHIHSIHSENISFVNKCTLYDRTKERRNVKRNPIIFFSNGVITCFDASIRFRWSHLVKSSSLFFSLQFRSVNRLSVAHLSGINHSAGNILHIHCATVIYLQKNCCQILSGRE